jgi:O-acetyl-ADP-ribose deacetylase (regulator of RNase III)
MKIVYVPGDLLNGETMIVHGCNAQGVMGRGVAKEIKERMPWAYEAYRREHVKDQIEKLLLARGHAVRLVNDPQSDQYGQKEVIEQIDQAITRRIAGPDPETFKGALRLGTVVWAMDNKHPQPGVQTARFRIVGNAITQEHWKKEYAVNGRNVDYDAVRSTLKEIDAFVKLTQNGYDADSHILIDNISPITRVGFPKIGAGLGGGEWDEIEAIIEAGSINFEPVVYLN